MILFHLMSTDGWTTDDLIFQWKRENPVQVAKNMHLPRFMLEKYEADFCNSVTNTGNRYVTNKAVGPSADQITFGASAEWMS